MEWEGEERKEEGMEGEGRNEKRREGMGGRKGYLLRTASRKYACPKLYMP